MTKKNGTDPVTNVKERELTLIVEPRHMWYQCVHCTRKTRKRADFTKLDDSVCNVCADAFERSGVEIKGHEPTPRRLQRTRASKSVKERRR